MSSCLHALASVLIATVTKEPAFKGPYCCCCADKAKVTAIKGEEVAIIDQVTLLGGDNKWAKANIAMRIPRPPYIGDKFSSRHGQKGVLSQQYPDTDMPFCAATGMRWAHP